MKSGRTEITVKDLEAARTDHNVDEILWLLDVAEDQMNQAKANWEIVRASNA